MLQKKKLVSVQYKQNKEKRGMSKDKDIYLEEERLC